jgi:radical SAM protein with 4Fe4S-binding SPASM domain
MNIVQTLRHGSQRLKHEALEALFIHAGVDRTKPMVIRAKPTERCNYRCGSCLCWRMDPYPEEMTLEGWQQTLGGLQAFVGHFTVQFAGGEPYVYKPFMALAEWCNANDIAWGVMTNGSAFVNSIAERTVMARPANVNISVDGATAAVHDASRGTNGSLRNIEKGIALLRKHRDAAQQSFPIRIKPTVHRHNFHEMPQMVTWAVSVGATSIDFAPVREWSDEVKTDLWLRPQDEAKLKDVIEQVIAAKAAGAPVETEESRLREWPAHFRHEVLLPTVAPCRVGMRDFHIESNGDVRTCWFYPKLGNLQRTPARDLWHGTIAQAQRREMLTCKSFGSPQCATSCMSHRSLGEDLGRLKTMARSPRWVKLHAA